jgi:glycerophosphoryl diester phosphodiesterase
MIRIAHRGLPTLFKENTLISFENALKFNPDYLELDIQKTSDNVFILFHDNTILFHNETKKISNITYKEIKNLLPYINTFEELCLFVSTKFYSYKKFFSYLPSIKNNNLKLKVNNNPESKVIIKKKFKMIRIPIIKSNILLDLKLSPDDLEIFIRCFLPLLLKIIPTSRLILQSSYMKDLNLILKKYKLTISRSYLYDNDNILSLNYDYLMINYRLLTKYSVDILHKFKIKIFVYTVNNIKDIQHIKKLNVDGICTDYINKY